LSITESTAERYTLHDPDVRLMLQVRDDNAAAFEELVARYQRRLVTVLEHLVADRDQAEDLAQDVFLRVYRARKNYQAGAKFSTWLFTIANNVASNALRSRSRRREVHLGGAGGATSAPQGLSHLAQAPSGSIPARRLDRAEMAEMVRAALESLHERQRFALLLNKFENMSYAEIAATMETTEKAVKSLLARARAALKEILEPYLLEGIRPASPSADETPSHP
jgi:RNA polymerase sigma-70 factor, ECF subfamily